MHVQRNAMIPVYKIGIYVEKKEEEDDALGKYW
jgi:hypothetical protein